MTPSGDPCNFFLFEHC